MRSKVGTPPSDCQVGKCELLVYTAPSASEISMSRVKKRWRGRTPTNKLVFVESDRNLLGRVESVKVTWTDGDARPPATLILGGLVGDPARHRVTVDGHDVLLSALAVRLLVALLEADGRVLGREQLLDALYGAGEGDVSDRAIDVYVKRIREKLGDDPDAPRFVATVRGAGYRAAGPVERREDGR